MPLTNAERQKKQGELKATGKSLYKAKESKRRKEKRILNGEKVCKAENNKRNINLKKLIKPLLMLL